MSVRFDPTLFGPTTPQTIRLLDGDIGVFGPASGALSIDGPGPDALVISAARGAFNVLTGNVSISGMGITGGNVGNDNVSNSSGTLSLRDMRFFDSPTDAIGNYGYSTQVGRLTVTDCTFSNNSTIGEVVLAGGILNYGIATVSGCTFSGNTSADGSGAIYNTGGLTVTSSTFLNNSAPGGRGGGGAIGNQPAPMFYPSNLMVLVGDTFVNNSAAAGGGAISNESNGGAGRGNLIVADCTFVGNSAASGAAVANFGSLRIDNTTIVGNPTTTIYGAALTTTYANATINNTIVAGNPGPRGAAADVLGSGTQIVTGSNNLIGTGGSGGLMNGADGNIVGVADPKLGPLGNYGGPTQTIPLLAGSPALDAGSNALAVDGSGNPLITDQRGLPRVFNRNVDIGAYEAQPPALAGDVNHDGKVDFSDLLLLAQHYGSTVQPLWENGDLTGDGAVEFPDLLVLAQKYGQPAGAAAVQPFDFMTQDLINLKTNLKARHHH